MSIKHRFPVVAAALLLCGCQGSLPYIADPAEVVTRSAAPPGRQARHLLEPG